MISLNLLRRHCLKCGCRFSFNLQPSSSRNFCSNISKLNVSKQYRNIVLLFRKDVKRNFGVLQGNRKNTTKLKDVSLRDLKSIIKLAVPHKRRIFIGTACLLVSSTIFLLMPRVLGKLLDAEDNNKKNIMTAEGDFTYKMAVYFRDNPVLLVGVMLIGATAICARIYFMHTAAQCVINDLRTKVFGSVLKQDIAFFDRNKVGEIVSRLSSDAFIVGNSVSSNLGEGARAIVSLFGTAGFMIYTSPQLSYLGALVIPFLMGSFYIFGRIQQRYTLQMQEAIASTNQLATERLSSIKTIRMLVAEIKELRTYKERISLIWEIARKEGFARGMMFGGFQFVGYFSITAILYYGNILIGQGLLTYGELTSFGIYAILCAGSINGVSVFYMELMKGLGASTRLFDMLNQKPEIPLSGGILIPDILKEIRFESVAFAYPNRGQLFNDVSFRIPIGSITAIVGPSGCGKSTIASLLLRLYNPTQGKITVDDHDLRELDPSAWRRIIGTVGQEPVLFSASIRDNIIYGVEESEKVTNEQVYEAALQANCLDFIRQFPDSFDTIVGEHASSMLSGGQRQRIAIARALITKPRLLILDEATSALDATSEYLIRKALYALFGNRRQTVVIIAHRLSTIKNADQIIVLDTGTVAEIGTYNELNAIENGIFRKLVEKQEIGWRDDQY